MSRMVVVQVRCDLCSGVFDEAAVPNIQMTVNGGTPVEVDVCDACSGTRRLDDIFNASRPILKTRDRKKNKAAPTLLQVTGAGRAVKEEERERTVPCGVKGCDFMGFSAQGVATHKARQHKIKGATKS